MAKIYKHLNTQERAVVMTMRATQSRAKRLCRSASTIRWPSCPPPPSTPTPPAMRKSAYTYDAKGNLLSHTVLAGTANATVVATMTYTADFNRLASVTDALGHLSTMSYE